MSSGNAILHIGVKADTQLLGRRSQGHKGVPGFASVLSARAKADIPFAHPLSDRQFGGVL